jgi:cytochrome c oxidase cbb3-type subunit 3
MRYSGENRSYCRRSVPGVVATILCGLSSLTAADNVADVTDTGEKIYRYYCYQCHGYAGDARTLASRSLSPPPRDFTRVTSDDYPLQRIVTAVLEGREGTAMVAFGSVLTDAEADAVARYVQRSFMSEDRLGARYHSAENGWPDHERYADAFPFIEGSITLEAPWESLSPEQRRGRRLYETACVSCHHQPNSPDAGTVVFELRAVSWPRRHFSHRDESSDRISGASPYAVHDVAPATPGLSKAALAGRILYEENCAFCHAADGTGRNWIGSFLDPRPRDFTDPEFRLIRDRAALEQRILIGIPGSSMPSWRNVLDESQVDAIIAYMQQAFATKE